jgi:hypothetical protein
VRASAIRTATTRDRRSVIAYAGGLITGWAKSKHGKTEKCGSRRWQRAIRPWRLCVTKPNSSRMSLKEAWWELTAVIRMGQRLKLDYVDGAAQLLPDRRCPRCMKKQTRIRCVRAFEGRVSLYSCMECKRLISTEVENRGEENHGERQAV